MLHTAAIIANRPMGRYQACRDQRHKRLNELEDAVLTIDIFTSFFGCVVNKNLSIYSVSVGVCVFLLSNES